MDDRTPMLKALLEVHGAVADLPNRWGFTALMWAKWLDHNEDIDLLVKHGAVLTPKDSDGLANLNLVRSVDGNDPNVANLLKWEGKDLLDGRQQQQRRRQQTSLLESGLQGRWMESANDIVASAKPIAAYLDEPKESLEDILTSLTDIPHKGEDQEEEDKVTKADMPGVLACARNFVANVVAAGLKAAPRDIFAMYVYTLERPPFYYVVNQAMRLPDTNDEEKAEKKDRIKKQNDIIYHLTTSFDCLQHSTDTVTTVYRGVKKKFINLSLYKPGKEVTWPPFSSTSLNLDIAANFADDGVVFVIEAKNICAPNIADFSRYPEEKELVYGPDSAFKVKNIFGYSISSIRLILECVQRGKDPTRFRPGLDEQQSEDQTAVIVYMTQMADGCNDT